MSRARGFKAARRKSQQRAAQLQDNAADAISQTVTEVHASGVENIDIMLRRRSGKLRQGYRKKMSRKSLKGLVGYVSAAARRSAFYARFVHDGTSNSKAYPYHDLAVLEHEGKHRSRMRKAQADALDHRAAPGSTGRNGGGKERDIE